MITVSEISRTAGGDTVELSASIDGLPGRPRTRRAWIRAPLEVAGDDARHDGSLWLVATLSSAVCLRRPLRIEGPVSSELLEGCHRAMELWSGWWRWLHPVEIEAGSVEPDPRHPARCACFFSGGVDSSYSVAKALSDRPDPPLSDLILVHGYDFPLHDRELRERVSASLRETAAALELRLVELETNLHPLLDRFAEWGRFLYGPLLCACGLALSRSFAAVTIPASFTHATVYPRASHPELDPLWSTEATRFEHDGLEAKRPQKLELIAQNQALLERLRVCYQNRDGAYNCGRCGKCLRTMIELQAIGALDRCPAFRGRPDPELVRATSPVHKVIKLYTRETLEELERRGIEPELQEALRAVIDGPDSRSALWNRIVFRARMARYRAGLPR